MLLGVLGPERWYGYRRRRPGTPPSGYGYRDWHVRGLGVGHYGCWSELAALIVGEEVAGVHG